VSEYYEGGGGIGKGRGGGGAHRPAPQRLPTARPRAPAGGPLPGTRLLREVVVGLREEPRAAAAAALRTNTKRCVLLVVDDQLPQTPRGVFGSGIGAIG